MQLNLSPRADSRLNPQGPRQLRLLETVVEQSNEASLQQTERLRASSQIAASKQASPFMIEKIDYELEESKNGQMYMIVADKPTAVRRITILEASRPTDDAEAYKTPSKPKPALDKQSSGKDSTSCKTGFFSMRKKTSRLD